MSKCCDSSECTKRDIHDWGDGRRRRKAFIAPSQATVDVNHRQSTHDDFFVRSVRGGAAGEGGKCFYIDGRALEIKEARLGEDVSSSRLEVTAGEDFSSIRLEVTAAWAGSVSGGKQIRRSSRLSLSGWGLFRSVVDVFHACNFGRGKSRPYSPHPRSTPLFFYSLRSSFLAALYRPPQLNCTCGKSRSVGD